MQHRSSEASQRVEAIPGIGVIGATAIVATVADPTIFRSGRDFAAWIGLVAAAGFDRGQAEARTDLQAGRSLLCGAFSSSGRSLCCGAPRRIPGSDPWLTQLLARRPFKVVAVALANKMARMAWALLAQWWHLSGA